MHTNWRTNPKHIYIPFLDIVPHITTFFTCIAVSTFTRLTRHTHTYCEGREACCEKWKPKVTANYVVWSPKSTNKWTTWQLVSVLPTVQAEGATQAGGKKKCSLCAAPVKKLEWGQKERVSFRWRNVSILPSYLSSQKLTNIRTSWQLKSVLPTARVMACWIYHMFSRRPRFSHFTTWLLLLTVQSTKEVSNTHG